LQFSLKKLLDAVRTCLLPNLHKWTDLEIFLSANQSMNVIGHNDKTRAACLLCEKAFLKNFQDNVAGLAGIEKATPLIGRKR
jgi:hypothetical protein